MWIIICGRRFEHDADECSFQADGVGSKEQWVAGAAALDRRGPRPVADEGTRLARIVRPRQAADDLRVPDQFRIETERSRP
ncbi:MAG TPA: hypothetical protein VF188_09725 [Longimicrobiales bacterium]